MKTSSDDESNQSWYEIDDGKAREKASQCLRERTPDIMSVVQSLKINCCKEDKAEKADKSQPLKEKTTVDKHSGPASWKDSKSSRTENLPSELNLGLHNQLQLWQLLQCQKMNMVSHEF